MPHTDHTNCSCTIKLLPKEQLISAANYAVGINPLNAPPVKALRAIMPGQVMPLDIAVVTTKYWGPKGVRLTVGFLDNPPADLRVRILSHMNSWGKWSNVQFVETTVDPQVRIARTAGEGYWSYLGTDINQPHLAGKATMNLDSFTMNTPDSEFYRVVRHETGHTLGFPHEHMRSEIVSRIDRAKAIAHFAQTIGWSEEKVIDNVLTPLDRSALIATAQTDINSIMCYWLPGSIMTDGIAVPGGPDINAQDAQFSAQIYPMAVLPSNIWPNGKAYFFKGAQYLRYDPKADKVDPGFPKPIQGNWPGFPSTFAAGVSAAVIWNDGKAYFFKGSEYIRYDIAGDKTDGGYPKPIAKNWPGLWTDNVDAGVIWPNSKAYFFKGAQYIRYDIATDKADPGYPKSISSGWPGFPPSFAAGVSAVAVWNNGKAYFFKGSEYIRYDIAADKTDPGYPRPIAGNWPGVWADNIDA
jgi:Hemopexin/Astacin (Peptidase family M12A)